MRDSKASAAECYALLNLQPDADWAEVKKAWRVMARTHHPDLNPDDPSAPARFIKIHRAFQILKTIHAGRSKKTFQSTAESFRNETPSARTESRRRTHPVEEIPRPVMDEGPGQGTERPFLFGKFWRRLPPEIRETAGMAWEAARNAVAEFETRWLPMDVHTTVTLDSRDARPGSALKVKNSGETVQVNLPRGSWNGVHVRVPEKGDSGILSGRRGDLFLHIQIKPAERADSGAALRNYNIRVSRELIRRGNKVLSLQTHEGPLKFVLPQNTYDGQSFVLRGKRNAQSSAVNHVVKVHLA